MNRTDVVVLRILVGGLALCLLVMCVGGVACALTGHDVPASGVTLAGTIVGFLGGLLVPPARRG